GREGLDPAQPERRHLQDQRGEARAQDLGVGEARALAEIVLAVEADADAVRRAPAAALALVGGGLRDRLDRQPLDLQARAVAADAGGARVDDVADAGDGERGLGDVGGQADAPPGVRSGGAASKWRLNWSGSIVAEVMTTLRSGRRGRMRLR